MASTTDRFGAKRQEPEETGQVTNRANPYSYQRTGDNQMTQVNAKKGKSILYWITLGTIFAAFFAVAAS
jgi:hypothetical protein